MMRSLAAFASGVVFALGLALGGMTRPSKVLGFLDFMGSWDPSLAFVMGGGVAVHFGLYRLIVKRRAPLLEPAFQIPTRRDIDPKLLGGAALFGVGWGLGGYCPGPALTSVVQGGHALAFCLAMLLGLGTQRWLASRSS